MVSSTVSSPFSAWLNACSRRGTSVRAARSRRGHHPRMRATVAMARAHVAHRAHDLERIADLREGKRAARRGWRSRRGGAAKGNSAAVRKHTTTGRRRGSRFLAARARSGLTDVDCPSARRLPRRRRSPGTWRSSPAAAPASAAASPPPTRGSAPTCASSAASRRSRDAPRASSSAATGRAVLALAADVRDPDAMAGVVAPTIERFGKLDTLVNGAAGNFLAPAAAAVAQRLPHGRRHRSGRDVPRRRAPRSRRCARAATASCSTSARRSTTTARRCRFTPRRRRPASTR